MRNFLRQSAIFVARITAVMFKFKSLLMACAAAIASSELYLIGNLCVR
jgi:hypothetical protein